MNNTDLDRATRELVLALADDELCMGQNHSWWIAVGPFLEEDLAFMCIAQDELGHARSLYALLADEAQTDVLAYRREPADYRSAHLTELPCHDWSFALVRHYLYDTAEAVRWRAMENSSWAELGAVARRALMEERVHEHHARSMMTRLLGSEAGQKHLGDALTQLAPLAVGLFDLAVPGLDSPDAQLPDAQLPDAQLPDAQLLAAGVINVSLAEQRKQWLSVITETLMPFGLEDFFAALSVATSNMSGTAAGELTIEPGRRGERSADFAALHQEMVEVYELEPSAHW